MSTHHTVSCRPEHCHWGFFDANLPPAVTVASGDTVTLDCVSGGRDIGVVFNHRQPGGVTVLPASGDVGAQFTPAVGWAQAVKYRAETMGREALALGWKSHNLLHVFEGLVELAWIATQRGDGYRAARWGGAAQRLGEMIGYPLQTSDHPTSLPSRRISSRMTSRTPGMPDGPCPSGKSLRRQPILTAGRPASRARGAACPCRRAPASASRE